MSDDRIPTKEELAEFRRLINANRYDFVKLAYLIFRFGEPGTEMENIHPYDWQVREWQLMTEHFSNPVTRFITYRLAVSSGNGAAKTAFGAMTNLILMYTQKLHGRVTANTQPQLNSVVWPEYGLWCGRARYFEHFFEKMGTALISRDAKVADKWRLDQFVWNDATPSRVSGLHNKGFAISYTFEESPGIPAIIWDYASGAFTDVGTVKLWMAFGNSDDPNSKFEQIMSSTPGWRTVRIDTRTLDHVSKEQISQWLKECGGNEDHDNFRVRVRGLPRKSAADAIINAEFVREAIDKGKTFEVGHVRALPSILTVDPAWTGGDETTIWHHQGPYSNLLERFKLDKAVGQDHSYTYQKICEWENTLRVDKVLIDQGEGTALKTLANINGKYHWELINFASSPNDTAEAKDSEYANMRAQMYYEANKALMDGHVICARKPEWLEDIGKQLSWTKGDRHKTSLKKLAEPKKDIKERIGASPDLADGFVLQFSRNITDRLEENVLGEQHLQTGSNTWVMPEQLPTYEMSYEDAERIYN